jgi:glycosyltransferase involved in cell wall biosynthesis
MRVGLIIYGDLHMVSGGFLYDRMLVEALKRQRHQVEIISLPLRSYAASLSDNLSIALSRRLRSGRFDIMLQDELSHPSLFWLNRQRKDRVDYPLVSIVHHLRCHELRPAWQNSFYRWIERKYLATLDGFIFNSQTTRDAVQALVGDQPRAIVAYPGGDRLNPALTPAKIVLRARQAGPLRIIFIGNLIPRKELYTLLAALTRLPKASWRLEVVGSPLVDTTYTQAIHHQIAQAGLANQVALLGPLADEVLAERLSQSHVLAVPSSYEGFGIVYLEGMGFGLPAIASTAGGAGEIISNGQNGFLIAPGDRGALAQHIQTLSQDRGRLLEMSLVAYQHYRELPTWAESTGRICEFLSRLASG